MYLSILYGYPPCFSFLQGPQEALAQSVLAEVPGQVAGFFNTMKLSPPHSNDPPSDLLASAPPSDAC